MKQAGKRRLSSYRVLLGAIGLGAMAAVATTALAADHRDGGDVKMAENISADINDVYAFMNNGKAVMAMTVFPNAPSDAAFSDAAVYVFHADKHAAFLAASTGTVDTLCTFAAPANGKQTFECWLGDSEYVTGDTSMTSGATSASGKVKVFAGKRADPFYFYLDDGTQTGGFNGARKAVQTAFPADIPANALNPNGCPILDNATAGALRGLLVATDQAQNNFANFNAMAIVVEVDPALLTDAQNPLFTVYASTHVKQ